MIHKDLQLLLLEAIELRLTNPLYHHHWCIGYKSDHYNLKLLVLT